MGFEIRINGEFFFYLAMNKSSCGHVPSRIGGHPKTNKRPNPIVVERGNEHCCSTASSKNIGPSSLIQTVIDIVNITVHLSEKKIKIKRS